jgi:hypothetical protein
MQFEAGAEAGPTGSARTVCLKALPLRASLFDFFQGAF